MVTVTLSACLFVSCSCIDQLVVFLVCRSQCLTCQARAGIGTCGSTITSKW